MKYFFKFTHILLLSFLFQNCNKKATSVFIARDAINIQDFGAVPNDGKDDSKAIQAAIDFAIHEGKSSLVYCPAGVYDLEKGVVIANQKKDGEYFFVTLTLTGPIAAYSGNQSIGKTAVFNLKNPTFAVTLQLARNCVVQNIVFQGCAKLPSKPIDIINWDEPKDAKQSKVNTNRFSPSCAVVIDPFHSNVPAPDKYQGFEQFYKNKGTGGSSMIRVDGCSFFNHYIALANNPSGSIANGDNIRLENCNSNLVHTFWSAGQTQSRDNSIQNVYCIAVNTFVSGTQIGQQYGTPPTLNNVSIAGFCKQLASLSTGFSGFSVNQSYMESVWSLGTMSLNFLSFNQTQIKFHAPTAEIYTPIYHLNTNAVASFTDCDIAYFSNCIYQIPFMMQAAHINISGGQVEGGFILPSGISNAGGEKLHNISYANVRMKCQNEVISQEYSGEILSNLYYHRFLGGARIRTYTNQDITLPGSTYHLEYMDAETELNEVNNESYFVSANPKWYNVKDNLLSGTIMFVGDKKQAIRCAVGYVDKIEGNKVFVVGCPKEALGKKHSIYKVGFHTFLPPISGKITKGSNRLENHNLDSKRLRVGDAIRLPGFAENTRIVEINSSFLILNNKSTKSQVIENFHQIALKNE